METKISQTRRFIVRHFSDHRLVARYLIAGGFGAFVNMASMYVFTSILSVWYITSAILAFLVSLAVTFFLQKLWTFNHTRSEAVHAWKQAGFYIFSSTSFLVLNILMLYALVDFLKIGYLFAQFLSLGTVACGSFLFNKAITFRKVEVVI